MKIRKSILTIAKELETRLTMQEKYCKENDYDEPYLMVHVELTYVVPSRTKRNWTSWDGRDKQYIDATHKIFFTL